jgi:hypothetical protein
VVLLQGWCGGTHCPAAFATETPEDDVVPSGPSLFVQLRMSCASHACAGVRPWYPRSAIQWTTNPYLWSTDTPPLVSPVMSVSVAGVDVSNATTPLVVSMTVGSTTPLSQFRCSYWNQATGNWSDSGTVVIGFESAADGSTTAICATLHLTDFSAVKKQSSECVRCLKEGISTAGLPSCCIALRVYNPSARGLVSLFSAITRTACGVCVWACHRFPDRVHN